MSQEKDAKEIVCKAEETLRECFREIEEVTYINQERICKAFQQHRVSQRHFAPTTGYAYDDQGRDCLDSLFAAVFGAEDALVRLHWTSGTHVISDALFALLEPNSKLISVTDAPYDTILTTINVLKEKYMLDYTQIPLTETYEINYSELKGNLQTTSDLNPSVVVYIQKSRGYAWRQALSVDEINRVVNYVKKINPHAYILVDNCYGEFVETKEPSAVGVDLTVGSLIKNPGGGIAPTGAYAAGTKKAIEKMASRLTSPSIGREVGSNPFGYRLFFQGLFLAPTVVENALKCATLFAHCFESLGYNVMPSAWDKRFDITQSIQIGKQQQVVDFCNKIQSCSPIDSYVTTEPWEMPGYDHKVVMAAGTFIEGASIELSADAPMTTPYSVYLQGGLTYAHCKYAVINVLKDFL